ncbi:MAG: GDP-mannose 4,6-dehydratase [Methanosarcinales archaeon]|nr:GDP-mannose 4,6-dehydratase [Methanosarcinales archaeon]
MKLLVTGGAGFIGSWLCERLVEMGEVVCLHNFDSYYSPQAKRKNIEPLIEHPDFKLVEGSILDRELLGRVFVDVDYVFHNAAQAGVRVSVENPGKTHEVNVTGTLNVLKAAVDCGIRAQS